MRVSVRQENLAKGLSIVSRAVDSRPTLPILGNVLLSTEDARLRLAAMDMSLGLGITCWIGAKVDQEGQITLPKNVLNELVNNLSPERVDLTLDTATQTMNVRCGAAVSNIRGIDAMEFPTVPTDGQPDIVVPGRVLREMINQTVFAVAKDDSRPILAGVYTEFSENIITMVTADGYRMALRKAQLEQGISGTTSLVIPSKTLAEIARIISEDDEEVGITLPHDRANILFHLNNVTVSSQLMEGTFPDFTMIIPDGYNTSTVVYTDDLLRACKRAEIFARDAVGGKAHVVVRPPSSAGEAGEIIIEGRSSERGDNTGIVDAAVEGEALDISFNIRYLIDVLNVINDERVVIQSSGSQRPSVIRPENRDDFLYVIAPIRS
jgi:DNA polymerase-3 subunit beta